MRSTTHASEEASAGRRRALLIGVGRTPFLERDDELARRFPPLDFVDRDIELVRAALDESGYAVDTLFAGHPDPAWRDTDAGSIVVAVERFLLSCSAGDTAFLYFSCHGVSVGEREYLLSSAAQVRASGALISHTILEASPEALLGTVPEGVKVVVCLDTCRSEDASPPAELHETPLTSSAYRDVAWLRASGRGQPAYADPHKGSYFGIALSQALSHTSAPKTFREVHAYVQGRVDHLTADLAEPSPTVEFQCVPGLEDELIVCHGTQQTERWAQAITGSVLWRHTSGGDGTHQRIKDELEDLAREVAKSRLGTDAALATPWSDPDYPIRVVDSLGLLVEAARLTGGERLSPAETAALLAAPLMHEGVVAIALGELALLRPDRLDRLEEGGRGKEPTEGHQRVVCDEAADICRAHGRVHHTAESLRQRKLTDAATAADHWLRHRFIADWDRLWDRTEDYPSVNRLLDRVVQAVAAGAEGLSGGRLTDVDQHVRRVLPHMTVPPGSSPRIDASSTPGWSRTERPVPGNSWRGWELACLLWLGALFAVDPRRMSSVLVDHLGAHRPLAPAAVVAALADCAWEPVEEDGTTRHVLRLACPHPALYAALEELAATADASVRSLHRRWHAEGRGAPDLLRGVPRKVTTEGLKPSDASYTVPLERFRLAEDEIRPLLMGTQLYGDRTLAVRELYQNALDACRHRRQRVQYGVKRKGFDAPDSEPEIHFLQAYEGDRPYIECRDEGSGMSREKLTSMFARAGKRYAQDPDYVQERRNWRRVGIEPVPLNSRFGIGVFSYFMLADEVTVLTEAVDEYGHPSRTSTPLRATVQSGSGLLQIGATDGPPGRGGTVVRLYLNHEGDEEEDLPSVVTTLRRVLWTSEFRVTAVELGPDGREISRDTWEPGELHAPEEQRAAWYGTAVKAAEGSWIVQGEGRLLLDGILVEDAVRPQGYVFNLRERHRPEPSVNRNSLVSYDEKAVMRDLLAAVPAAASALDEISLPWLWDLADATPRLAVRLFDSLPPTTVGVLVSEWFEFMHSTVRVPLRRVGVFDMDPSHLESWSSPAFWESARPTWPQLLNNWRTAAAGIASPRAVPFTPGNYPEPIGLDILLMSERMLRPGWDAALTGAAHADISLAEGVRALRRWAVAGAHVPVPSSMADLRAFGTPTVEMTDLHDAYEEFSTPGRGPRAASHMPLLTVAARRGVAPSRLLPALDALLRIGVDLPGTGALDTVDLTTKLLEPEKSFLNASVHSWGGGQARWVDLLAAVPSPVQRRRLSERFAALRPLGAPLFDDVPEEILDREALGPFERKLLSRDVDGRGPWLPNGRLSMRKFLTHATELQRPLGEVAEEIARLTATTGVSAPDVPEECRHWIPDRWVSQAAREPRPGTADPTPVTHPGWRVVLHARHNLLRDSEDLRRDLLRLEALGCLEDSVETLIAQVDHFSPAFSDLLTHIPSTRTWDGSGSEVDSGHLSVPFLFSYAATAGETLGSVVDEVAHADLRLPLRLPALPAEAGALKPHRADAGHLVRHEAGRAAFRDRLDIHDVLALAQERESPLGETSEALGSYRCLGAPPVPGTVTDALADLVPTDFDVVAFDPDLLGPGTLGPLELVLVAGRFGWTLGGTYDRYAPFASLGLRVATPEPLGEEREIVPGWRDVIVLTAQLTGRSPAVSGTVTDAHVVLCAEETEQSEDGVRDILRRYARLFSLVVPAPGGPDS
ncbi:caspase family protein [Streptomyces sp. NPDC020807]|uniref:HD domain-containing protein n=1 Tax=Streptomyces sp. NPDC020807 TaxID=3155119 RepID=UPI0033FD7938